MNTPFSFVALCSAAFATTIVLSGCGKQALAKEEKPYLSTFLAIHHQYCEKKYDSQASLLQRLEKSPELRLAADFNGVYEIKKDGISYAVSPEEDGCTTDVMIQTPKHSELFSFEEIDQALLAVGYVETSEPKSRDDVGTDQTRLTVLEKKYISPTGEVTVLDFPLEKKDKYYMTLFAEKFTTAKQEHRQKIISNMTMAEL